MDTTEEEEDYLTVTHSGTNQTVKIPIIFGQAIDAMELKKIKIPDNKPVPGVVGLRTFDPGYKNTASSNSKITFIDGENGVLLYRGYPIEELAEKSTFLEVAFLLIHGELPNKNEYDFWKSKIMGHTYVHESLLSMLKNFRYDAHPMGILISSMAALSTYFPRGNPALQGEGLYKNNNDLLNKQIYRILGKIGTIAANCYRHRIGRPYTYPNAGMGYCENFLYMMDALGEKDYAPHPLLVQALNVLFILHADHEVNCSTSTMRHVGSSLVDPFSAVSAAASSLFGPKHGGANERVLRMLISIGSIENIPEFLAKVKAKETVLAGFGHRVYRNYDPRARIIRKLAYKIFHAFEIDEPLVALAVELERQALADPYFVKRRLYPNVDFYSGLIYKAFGFPTDMFPVLFCIPRCAGWLAHWKEQINSTDDKIYRPRQIYTGSNLRHYVPLEQRESSNVGKTLNTFTSAFHRRRILSLNEKNNSNDDTPLIL